MPPWTAARGSNSRFGMCSDSVRQKTPNLFRPLDPVRLQPVADPPEQALLLEMEPAFALLGEAREHVLESAERSLACDGDLEQLPQLGVGDGPDEFLHVAVTLVRVLRLDGQEPAGRILLDLLDRQRQLVFLFLTEAEHHPRFLVEHPGELAALILECPAELFQVELQLLRHQRGFYPKTGCRGACRQRPCRRKSSSSRLTCSACVQFRPCGPPFTTTSRLPLTASCVRFPVTSIGRMRSESP